MSEICSFWNLNCMDDIIWLHIYWRRNELAIVSENRVLWSIDSLGEGRDTLLTYVYSLIKPNRSLLVVFLYAFMPGNHISWFRGEDLHIGILLLRYWRVNCDYTLCQDLDEGFSFLGLGLKSIPNLAGTKRFTLLNSMNGWYQLQYYENCSRNFEL